MFQERGEKFNAGGSHMGWMQETGSPESFSLNSCMSN